MMLTDSILNSIKKLLGISEDDSSFDEDVLIHLNTALLSLTQIGVGPASGFIVTGEDETWEDFIEDDNLLHSVKTYLYIKTRLVFDQPTNSSVAEALRQSANEIEWRLQHVVEIMESEDDDE